MAKREITVGSTDQTIDVFIQDSSSTTGAGLSGLVYNTASLACYYRKGATGSATQLSLATQTVGGAHSDGGFVEIQATNMKGVYRLDLSDTMVAAAGMLTIMLYGATNMAPVVAEIEVVATNKFDAVRGGMTALPNANADAAGGLPISDAGGLDLDAQRTDVSAILTDTGTTLDGKIDSILTDTGTTLDGKIDSILADTAELQTDWANGGRLDLLLDATLADTNELQTDWANGGRLDLIVDAILDDTDLIDDGTSGLAKIATDVAAILVDTGTDIPATLSTIATDTTTDIPATLSTIAGYLDTEIAAIKAKTDNLPSDPADASDVAAAITAAWTTALTESYATDGSAATPAQLLYMILCSVSEFSISGTTITGKKLDGSTTAMTWTIDSATDPTSRTRAS